MLGRFIARSSDCRQQLGQPLGVELTEVHMDSVKARARAACSDQFVRELGGFEEGKAEVEGNAGEVGVGGAEGVGEGAGFAGEENRARGRAYRAVKEGGLAVAAGWVA